MDPSRRLKACAAITTGLALAAVVIGVIAAVHLMPRGRVPTRSEASWAQSYASISGLARAADLVGVFRVDRVVQVRKEPGGVELTDFEAALIQRIKGPAQNPVIIRQTGGPDMAVADDPLMRPGDEYVLFLHRYAPGRYYVLGGPQGRFALDGQGRVWSLDAIDPGVRDALAAGLQVRGKPLAELASEVR